MTFVDYEQAHSPVLLWETIDALAVKEDGLYLDLTTGAGGHSERILERLGAGGRLYAADRDPRALELSSARLSAVKSKGSFQMIHATFSQFPDWLPDDEIGAVDGLLADLGVSSPQLDLGERGFSYLNDGPLDMRMNQEEGLTAAQLLVEISEEELTNLLRVYGEERYASSIAGAIIRRRKIKPITGTLELAKIVAGAVPARERRDGNPARKTFQAIRMAVNREQEELAHLLSEIPSTMAQGGRLTLISFHSLEDRMVKQAMRRWQEPCECPRDFPHCVCGKQSLGHQLTPRPLTASTEELERNARARSAKLRAFEFRGGTS